jgi:hypothetical protein
MLSLSQAKLLAGFSDLVVQDGKQISHSWIHATKARKLNQNLAQLKTVQCRMILNAGKCQLLLHVNMFPSALPSLRLYPHCLRI